MIKSMLTAAALWAQAAVVSAVASDFSPLYDTSLEQVMLKNMCTNDATRVLALAITNLRWTVEIEAQSNCTYRAIEELELTDNWTKHYTALPFSVDDQYVLRWRWTAPADGRVRLSAVRVARPRAVLVITKEEEQ